MLYITEISKYNFSSNLKKQQKDVIMKSVS